MKINTKIITYFLGFLLLINGGFMFLSALLSYIYKDGITGDLILSGTIVSIIGLLMLFLNKNHDKQINKREGYLVVVLGWVIMIFSGTIPYLLTGTIEGFSNIFFETTSGYTATGATIINDVEILPEGILFWRSITHWLGGMGMIVFAIAILPLLGIGGMQLFSAESPGPSTDKLHPRITDTAKRLWLIYVSYTIIETIFLQFAGMSFFDAINHSMSNIASGGFSTKNASLGHWNSNPMIQYIEKIKLSNKDNIKIPDAILIRPKIVAVFDNIKDIISLMTVTYPSKKISAEKAYRKNKLLIDKTIKKLEKSILKPAQKKNKKSKLKFKSNFKKEQFYKIVNKAKEYIKNGDIFQVVPSQRFETKYNLKAVNLYRSLRRLNPSPYLVNLNFDKIGLVASSPELMVQLRNKKVTIRPIAGTRKRGKNASEDLYLSNDLLNDKKELAEHLMLLDLGRNDVGRVAKKGTVNVTEKMIIEYYSHVMHIVSNVEGKIDNNLDALDALMAGFPAGTVSGAPKIRAMEIIEELENLNRSFYAGCMGYFDSNGDMDTCISLRTGLVKDNKLYIQAGAGIVYDSVPKNEHQEILNKAGALMAAAEDSYKFDI